MTNGTDEFGHDPEDTADYTNADVQSLEEANRRAAEEGHGVGYVLSRHDGLLVIEMAGVLGPMGLYTKAGRIIDALGETYRERDTEQTSLLRSLYRGQLPGDLHGGDPVTIGVGDGPNSFTIRLYDSGWFPVFGPHDGFDNDIGEVNENALHRLLTMAGKEWEDADE